MEEEGKWQNGGEMSPVWHQFSILQDSDIYRFNFAPSSQSKG